MSAMHVSELDHCPKCGAQWAYKVNGKRYSHLCGSISGDRVVAWVCPSCGASWGRSAMVELIGVS